MACLAKHTKYQPTKEEFKCPRCGVGPPDGLCVDNPSGDAADDCDLLHVDDDLRCYGENKNGYSCNYVVAATSFAKMIVKKNNLVPCPACKGTGHVKKEQ